VTMTDCLECAGSGFCGGCAGNGLVLATFTRNVCMTCQGTGRTGLAWCQGCGGNGRQLMYEELIPCEDCVGDGSCAPCVGTGRQ